MILKKTTSYIHNLRKDKLLTEEYVGRRGIRFGNLLNTNVLTPPCFSVTTLAFDDFILANGLADDIMESLSKVRPFIKQAAVKASEEILGMFDSATVPAGITEEILNAYFSLGNSYGKAYIEVESSNIIPTKFIPESLKTIRYEEIKGEGQLLSAIFEIWRSVFSTEAIEYRTNGYYDGPLSTAVVIKKVIRAESSGKAYSIPPITKDKGNSEIYAVYGLYEGLDAQSTGDVYKVSDKNFEILERTIVPQDYMILHTGNSEERVQKVNISPDWQKRQKLEDNRIKEIAKLIKKVEKMTKTFVELDWAIEAGKIYITDIRDQKVRELDLTEPESKAEKDFLKKYDVEVKDEPKKYEPKLEQLEKEIRDVAEGRTSSLPKSIKTLVIPRKSKTTQTERWSQKFDIATELYLDISNLQSSEIEIIEFYNGAFFDGTEIILHTEILPELHFDEFNALNSLVDTYAIDISTAAKNASTGKLIYKFSNITETEYAILNLQNKPNQFAGDERFIENPKALVVETMGVKKAKEDYSCDNISICFPAVRSIKNLQDLKSIVASQGLRRSQNTKFYAEVSMPSFAYELEDLPDGLIDGVIINYSTLLPLLMYRTNVRELDHQLGTKVVEKILKQCADNDLNCAIYMENFNLDFIKSLPKPSFNLMIFGVSPSEDQVKKLDKYLDKALNHKEKSVNIVPLEEAK